MKRIISLGLLVSSLFSYECCEEKSIWDYHPIHVGGNGIFLGKGNVTPRVSSQEGGELLFNKVNGFVYSFLPISDCSFFIPRVEWNRFTMDWNQNPRFQETHFQYVQFALTFLSQAVESWRWIGRIDYNIDIQHFADPRSYGLFSALLWGTHEFHKKWHYHVGALGYTGFEGQEIYPVIGLDFAPNKKWLFQAVFPITYSIEYALNEEWRCSLKGRPLKERFRVGARELFPRSIFSYSSMGVEANLHYEKSLRLELELFAGYNFGGSFYIKDQLGKQSLYTDIEGSPYVGASLNWGI